MTAPTWTEYERSQATAIRAWRGKEPSVASKVVGFIAMPLAWLVGKIIPDAAILGALNFSNACAAYCTDLEDIKREAGVSTIRELHTLQLERLDELANSTHNWAVGLAATEGAATGATGLVGIAVDVPIIVTLALRTIHKIGACYGYEPVSEYDAQYAYGIMSSSASNTMKEKAASLITLRALRVTLERQTWKAMAEKAAAQQLGKEGALIAIRALAKQLGINLTKRKALQAIPLVGAAVGASANGWWIQDVGWAARRSFQERWLSDHGKQVIE